MATIQNTTPAYPVVAKVPPPEGNAIIPVDIVLAPGDYAVTGNYSLGPQQGITQVMTLFVDNSTNPQDLTIVHGVASLTNVIPAGGGAFVPTSSATGYYQFSASVSNAPGGNVDVQLALYNYAVQPSTWGTQIVTVNTSAPIGAIILWYGSAVSIPAGWGLCDGSTYSRSDGAGNIVSPNLVNFFPLGANAGSQGTSGGSKTISQANLPNVNFTVTDAGHAHGVVDPGHSHRVPSGGNGPPFTALASGAPGGTLASQSATTGVTVSSATTGISVASGGSASDYLPPYLALCYIMKT